MKKLTKTIVVNGQEMVMSSVDGQSWFLRTESMYEFEKRLQDVPSRNDELEIEEADLQPEEDLAHVLR